jgi:hypothetical protein
MWPWIVLGMGWVTAGYWSLNSLRKLRMAEPADPVRAIANRFRIAIGLAVSLLILFAFSFGSLLTIVEKNSAAKWASSLTLLSCLVGALILWKWFWKKRRPPLRPPL